MTQIDWSKVVPGERLPVLTRTPSTTQLFMFSAVTWNRHRIHYEKEFAISDGLADVAVHRSLLGAFLGQLLVAWAGRSGRIVSMSFSVRGSAILDSPLTCSGEVSGCRTEDGRDLVDCIVWVDDEHGQRLVPATATIERV